MDGTFLVPVNNGNQSTQLDAVFGKASGFGMFIGSNAAAGNTVAAVGVNSAPCLYNPPSSNVALRIQSVHIGVISGTVIAGNLGYAIQKDPVLSALTEGGIITGSFLFRTQPSQAKLYTALTVAAAPTWIGTNGLSAGGALAAGPLFNLRDDINGAIVVPPGSAFWPFVSINAVALVANVTVRWIEVPIPTGV
jgi:hypothetical protein